MGLSSWACGTGTSTITNLFDAAGDTFQVTALNSVGQFTGYFQRPGHQPHAFLYSNNGGIVDLGSLGGDYSQADAINNLGQVVGSTMASDFNFHAFLYSGGLLSDLGTLGGTFGEATAINDAGQVVGDATTTDDLATEAFLYANGTLSSLGSLGGDSSAFAINSSGMICGESIIPVGDTHGFVYSGGTMTDVGTLGGHYSSCSALNDAGTVVGESWIANGSTHAFSYSGGTMADLGTLGGTFSSASAINSLGQIIGLSKTASGQFHGFLYSAGSMIDLVTLGGTSSQANAINNHGQVVGKAAIVSGLSHACLWQNGTVVDLNTLLSANSGWQLLNAAFINDTGRILGTGLYNGVSQWFILDLASENHPPVANAGVDQTVDCQSQVTLDGSHSSDPDGDTLSFEWSLHGNILGTSATLTVSLPIGTNVVTLKVNDPCGATAQTNVVVTVADTSAPAGSCPSNATASSDANCQAQVPDFVSQVVASDNCTPSGSLTITQNPVAGTLVGLGPHPVSLSMSDSSGNSTTCTVLFTVVDTNAPTIVSVSGPITLPAGADCQAAAPDVVGNVVATDNCTPVSQLHVTQSPVVGTLLAGGQHSITVTVTDGSGNSTTGSVLVTVVDTTAPSIVSMPEPITLSADANCQAAVPNIVGSVVATDNCTAANQLVVTQNPAAGTLLGPGQYTIAVAVADAAGNSSSAGVPLTISGSVPVIQSISVNPSILSPPNHQIVPVTVSVVTSGGCNGSVVSKIVQITASEPTQPGDILITGDLTASLAASKNSTGATRIYAITVQSMDSAGNTSTGTVTVTVPKSNGTSAGTGTSGATRKLTK